MAWTPSRSFCLHVRVIVGVYSMMAVHSLVSIWGNVSIYIISYIHFRVEDKSVINSSWAISLNVMAWSAGMVCCNKLIRILGFRITMVTVTLGFSAFAGLCFLLVQHSFISVVFSLAGGGGFLYGVGHGLQLKLVSMWVEPKYLCFACCSILSTQQAGGAIMNLIVTYYINPGNVEPNRHVLMLNLFSQPTVLDKVPFVFVVYSAICLGLACLSFVLIKLNPQLDAGKHQDEYLRNDCKTIAHNVTDGSREKQRINQLTKDCHNNIIVCDGVIGHATDEIPRDIKQKESTTNNSQEVNYNVPGDFNDKENKTFATNTSHKVVSDSDDVGGTVNNTITSTGRDIQASSLINSITDVPYENTSAQDKKQRRESLFNDCVDSPHLCPSDLDGRHVDNGQTKQVNQTISEKTQLNVNQNKSSKYDGLKTGNVVNSGLKNVTPKQALKTKTFYALFLMVACSDIAFIIIMTYYKAFGTLYYPDDHFFTNTGVTLNVATFVAVNLSGLACDRFEVKNTTVANSFLVAILSCFMYISVHVNKWFYGAWVVLYGGNVMSVYSLVSVCAIKYFGDTHGTTIYGMAMMATYITTTSMPFLIRQILYTYGWFALHTIGSGASVILLISVVLGLGPVT